MSKNKNILIVGGTGFIGFHLAKECLKREWKVTSISKNKPKKKRYISNVEYINCDITNKKNLKIKIKKNFNYVVNLGGYVDHSDKKKTYKSHYIGCKNLTEIFLKKKLIAFVQIGSSGEYGHLQSPQKENDKCNPKSTYGVAKLLSSKHLINLFKEKNFPMTILRLYQAYGPKQDTNRFIPYIIEGCKKNKKFPCSEGKQWRDFVHVNDVIRAIMKSLFSKKAKGEIINIGSGKPKKIKSIINYLKKIIKGGYPQFGKIPLRKDDILKIYPSVKKAKKIIKWKPKIPFRKGINHTIQSYNG